MTGASTNTLALAAPLAAVTGAEHVRALADAVAVAPANSDELAAILRFANTNHCSVVPWGGGTKQGWGNRVTAAIVLETHRLNQVRGTYLAGYDLHCRSRLYLGVDAGCPGTTWAARGA
jgi:glycolate oxidase FAD binding subunit